MPYGQFLYGTGLFGQDTVTEPPIDSHIPDLMQYLPPFYERSRVMKEIQAACATEIGYLRYALNDLLAQFFVSTATWGLDLWEAELGISTDRTKSYARRREVLKAKLRGAGTSTKQMIRNAAAAFSGGEVDVIEYPAEGRFVVKFIGIFGIPPNMAGFIQMLDQIKPAHLTYTFEYTYTTWSMLQDMTWGTAGTMTWGQIRTYGG